MIRQPMSSAIKKFGLASLLVFGAIAPSQAASPLPPVEVQDIPVAVLVDVGSGQVLHAKNADRRFLPASMTKVMTAYVAFEEMNAGRLNPGRVFVVKPEIAREWHGRGTSMYLEPGDRVTTHQLVRGIMTASANDASVVLADGYAGSVAAWTFMMNDAAKRLGMKNSHFATPSGWPDEGQTYVSANDLVTLANATLRNFPAYYGAYSGKKTFAWKDGILRSRDPITGVVLGADGIKTGYTREAGYNFLGSAKQGIRRLVMVVGGAATPVQRNAASIAYLEWGFSQFRARPLYGEGQYIVTAKVQGGDARHVSLVARQPVYATVPNGANEAITLRAHYAGPLQAPIRKDQQVGELEIKVAGMPAGKIPLYAASAVSIGGPIDRVFNGLMNLVS